MPRGGGENGLRGYGDLKVRNRAGRGDKADQAEDDVGQWRGVGANKADCSVVHWARNGVID
jgi:hypothetical protein